METSEKIGTSMGGGYRKKRPASEFRDVYVEFEGPRRSRRFFFNLHKRLMENREKERRWMEQLRKEELAMALERCTHFAVDVKAEMRESVNGTSTPSEHRPNPWAVFQVDRPPKFA